MAKKKATVKKGRTGVAGEVRYPAPKQTTWYHGTNDKSADEIVKSQKLYGSGDFGDGGYLATDESHALDWTHTEPRQFHDSQDMADFPGLVRADLRPKRPYYGGEGKNVDSVMQKIKSQGNDVWFPLKGATSKNPGSYAVIMDNNVGRSATFHKATLPWSIADDYHDYDPDDPANW